MKRFCAALALVAIAQAQDTEDVEAAAENAQAAADAAEQGSEFLESAGDFFSSAQEPVAFTSIATADPCMLDGTYGWFKAVGTEQVYIAHTVSGCDIYDGARVLTWAQIENPDDPGQYEGFYCTITFDQSDTTAMTSADVETQSGALDYASWNTVQRRDWCKDESSERMLQDDGADDEEEEDKTGCKRFSVSQWQKLLTDAETNYPISYDNATSTGSATCTARRFLSTPGNYMEIMKGTGYSVTSGYIIYNNEADYDAGTASSFGSGEAQEFMFDAAATLFAGAAALTASLLA